MSDIFNMVFIVFFILFQMDALADARPVTYNITMDYNSVTNQFENINATGSATIRVDTTGYWPIEIRMQKDGVTGLTPEEAGGGNQQFALRREYTDFSFELRHKIENGLSIPVNAFLKESIVNYRKGSSYFTQHYFNNNCDEVSSNIDRLIIKASSGSGCSGQTYQYDVSDKKKTFTDTSMHFGFDTLDKIKSTLSLPNYKAGDYIGSVTYTGDSIRSRVNGRMSESYTFNFIVTKKKQLNSFNFPSGTVANFIVSNYGNQYVGTSELYFNVDGVFNASDKMRFTFRSENSRHGKFNLKHSTDDKFIPYNIELFDVKVGRAILFNTQNETKLISNSSENILNGKFYFNFSISSNDVVIGDYSDQLTVLVALDI